jgi:hypothetical protein
MKFHFTHNLSISSTRPERLGHKSSSAWFIFSSPMFPHHPFYYHGCFCLRHCADLFLTCFFLFVILCFCIEFLFVYVAFCTRFSAVLFHFFFVCLVLFFFFILIYLFTCCKYYLVLSCTSVSQINAQVLDLLLSCVSFVL